MFGNPTYTPFGFFALLAIGSVLIISTFFPLLDPFFGRDKQGNPRSKRERILGGALFIETAMTMLASAPQHLTLYRFLEILGVIMFCCLLWIIWLDNAAAEKRQHTKRNSSTKK